ncbi:hypothetical protein [Saccharicrinis sp. FJH54]|uniref:hypothetical protein n=1 Tax=Saccharicrinis sp. FJH54 TaxID=3344665 RepID=UPI0035D45BB6
MKPKRSKYNVLAGLLFFIIIPGCVVISFYPLYEEKDLFANDLLLGKWYGDDSTVWIFNYPTVKKNGIKIDDSTGYVMQIVTADGETEKSTLAVHVIKLDNRYYLDFYLDNYAPTKGDRGDFVLFDLHMMPVHTFARLDYWNDSVEISWFDPDWLDQQIRENRVRIRHEKNESNTLLTARPHELQEFVRKYGHLDDAYSMDQKLIKIK